MKNPKPNKDKHLTTAETAYCFMRAKKENGGLTESDFTNSIISSCLDVGDVKPLIHILRSGDVGILDQRTWNSLADFLDGKNIKKKGPQKKLSDFNRNFGIYLRYQGLSQIHGYDRAIDILVDTLPLSLGRKAIEKIITSFNKTFNAIKEAEKVMNSLDPTRID